MSRLNKTPKRERKLIPADAEDVSLPLEDGSLRTTIEFDSVDPTLCPDVDSMLRWAAAALRDPAAAACIRVVGSEEMRTSNKRWRNADYPTNVLSFPADLPAEFGLPHLGDILICAEVVDAEWRQQNKSAAAHWAHMIVHGMLHLQGYDHENDEEGAVMEALEIAILAELGFANPYLSPAPGANA